MRKLFFLWTSVAVLAMAASCTLNKLEETPMPGSGGTQVTFTATAADSGSGTKALLVDGAPDIYWAPGDEILAFHLGWGSTKLSSTNVEPATVATFSGNVNGSAGAVSPENQVWAAYPASWDKVWFDYEQGEYVEMTLPFTQTATAGTFDPMALMMLARSASQELAFYHVGGGLKFKLTQDWVKQVELRSNDGTPLAGYVQVVMDGQGLPTVSEYYETTDVVRLTAPKGETLQPGVWYYLCCLPAVLKEGYTLTFRSETQTGAVNHISAAEVKRATWGVLEAADGGVVPMIAENDLYGDTIYYTTTDGAIVEPKNVWGFGANIVSNTYENGQGVILFDGPVTGIPDSAFDYRQTLKSIRIPSTVWEIGGYAFSYCSSLQSITLPEGLASIEDCAFQACVLPEIYIPGGIHNVSPMAFNGNQIAAFRGPLATADGRGLVLDGTMVGFARGGLSYPFDYEIPEGVTCLGDRLFSYCYTLRKLIFPQSLESFGNNVFESSPYLTEFDGKFASEDGHLLVKDGVVVGAALHGVTEFTIPGSVKSIAPNAFSEKITLQTLTLEEGVESIGEYAFAFCNNLHEITLPESLKSLGQRVFYGDNNISQFRGVFASENGHFLIVGGVLKAAAAIELVNCKVPDGVTRIDNWAFRNTSLETITFPESLTEIGEDAFAYCSQLKEITLPQSLRRIENGAFLNCQSEEFTSFTIPAGVTEIGNAILSECDHLTSVTVMPAVPPTVYENGMPLNWNTVKYPILVPEGSLAAYQNADGWRYQGTYQVKPENHVGTSESMGEKDWD